MRRIALATCVLLAACARKPSSEAKPAASSSAAPPSASVASSAVPPPPGVRGTLDVEYGDEPAAPSPNAPAMGPAASGDPSATVDSRRRAALDVLFGGRAAELERDALDPGAVFNASLRDVVAPEVMTSGSKAPRLRIGAAEVTGKLEAMVVQRIVRQYFGRFRACYEQELLKHPNAEGRLQLRFQIDERGGVKAPSVEPTGLSKPMATCVREAMSSLTFPAPPGPVRVGLPIAFSPG